MSSFDVLVANSKQLQGSALGSQTTTNSFYELVNRTNKVVRVPIEINSKLTIFWNIVVTLHLIAKELENAPYVGTTAGG